MSFWDGLSGLLGGGGSSQGGGLSGLIGGAMDMSDPKKRALIGMATGLGDAGGWHALPVSTATAFNEALKGGVSGYDTAQKEIREKDKLNMEGMYKNLEFQSKMAEANQPKLQFNPLTGDMYDMKTGSPWTPQQSSALPWKTPTANAGQTDGNIQVRDLPPISGGGVGGLGIGGGNTPPTTGEEKFTAATAGMDPKDFYALNPKARQEAFNSYAKKQAEAAAINNDPEIRKAKLQAAADLQDTITQIDNLVKHPGFETSVGRQGVSYLFGFKPGEEPFAGTDAAGFRAGLKQLQGKQFLSAYKSLKGGGAISEIEGAKAQAAQARMDSAQSEDDFKAAAKEFRDILQNSLDQTKGLPPAPSVKAAGKQTVIPPNVRMEDIANAIRAKGGQI